MQPFEGIRVIDMTHVLAGPFCTYQLAVLGADVIKVEPPKYPDMTRQVGVAPERNDEYYGTYFMAQNAGKRAMSLDIKTEKGKQIFKQLIKTADVLVENYRGGSLERLGLGYTELTKLYPSLIYCSLTGFGHTGPKCSDPAYDVIIQAFSGIMSMNGELGAPPVSVGPPMVDYGAGSQAAFAISAALFQRGQTGKGQHIDVSMLDAALMLMSSNVAATQTNSHPPQAQGNAHPHYAGYATYDTKEGILMVGAWTNQQMSTLFRILGDTKRADAVEGTPRGEVSMRLETDTEFLQGKLAEKSADEWEKLLNGAGIPAARVRRLDEAMGHEQVASRTVLQSYPGAERAGVPNALSVAAFSYDHGGPKLSRQPPKVGEHTIDIMKELEYDAITISHLEEMGVISTKPPISDFD